MSDAPLLDYIISTSPQPLQIGTPGKAAMGTINIYAAAKAVVYCSEIEIAVKVGNNAGCLFANPPDSGVNTGKWVTSSFKIVPGESLGLGSGEFAKFVFQPRDPADEKITYDLVFSLSGQVNDVLGDCLILILETSSETSDGKFVSRIGQRATTLAPPVFYLQNLVATQVGKPTVPCSEFAAGAAINLAWESNGTWFQLYAKGKATPIWAGVETTVCLTAGVKTDTTFILVAAMSGMPAGDALTSFQPIFLFDALTVTVSNPELVAQSLEFAGAKPGATPTRVSYQKIEGDIIFTGNVTFEKDVVFRDQAVFNSNTVFSEDATFLQAVTFQQPMTFEQAVSFNGTVYLNNQNTIISRLIFTSHNKENWYIYNSEDGSLSFQRLDRTMSLTTNYKIKDFGGNNLISSGDEILIKSLASTQVTNEYLAWNSQKDWWIQAQWFNIKDKPSCKMQIMNY